MRASIPALFVFWAFVSKTILDVDFEIKNRFRWLYITLLVVITLGFYSGIVEISRSISNYEFGPPLIAEMEEYTYEFDSEKVIQRVGMEDSFFYRHLSK